MTPNEAHDFTMGVVRDLQDQGVDIQIRLYDLRSDHGKDMAAKYASKPERASPDKWCKVKLKPLTHEHRQLVSAAAKKLAWMGVSFDTGGGLGIRDWELDWSFRYSGQQNNAQEEKLGIVDDLISGLESGHFPGPDEDDPGEEWKKNK